MCAVPVFYATSEGQTQRIAARIAEQIRKHGLDSQAIAITSAEGSEIEWNQVRGAAVGASLHRQKHQREAIRFAHAHRAELSAIPSLFFSVSLAAASKNANEVQAAERLAEVFAAMTGWKPTRTASIAGRLAYTRYNWLLRRFMRHIAIKEGASADTSRDHEYTDWEGVEKLANNLAYEIRRREIFPEGGRPFFPAAS